MLTFYEWINEVKEIARDKSGYDLQLYTNEDGTIDIYHATNKDAYDKILTTGKWLTNHNDDVFFSSSVKGDYRAGMYVVHVQILPQYVYFDEKFGKIIPPQL